MNNLKLRSSQFHSLSGMKVGKCRVFILLQNTGCLGKGDEKLLISGFPSNPLILQISALAEDFLIS